MRRQASHPARTFGASERPKVTGLTILAIDTGSRMDEVIFQDFRGTGNMELILDRSIADRHYSPPSTC